MHSVKILCFHLVCSHEYIILSFIFKIDSIISNKFSEVAILIVSLINTIVAALIHIVKEKRAVVISQETLCSWDNNLVRVTRPDRLRITWIYNDKRYFSPGTWAARRLTRREKTYFHCAESLFNPDVGVSNWSLGPDWWYFNQHENQSRLINPYFLHQARKG